MQAGATSPFSPVSKLLDMACRLTVGLKAVKLICARMGRALPLRSTSLRTTARRDLLADAQGSSGIGVARDGRLDRPVPGGGGLEDAPARRLVGTKGDYSFVRPICL